MGKPSKEAKILEIFFDYPSKNWHFKEIKAIVKMADNKISRWLKIFMEKRLIKRIKEKGRMPYYAADYDFPNYRNAKRFFALKLFYDSGFLNHLASLKDAKDIILFGSFARADWHKKSDIDIFIYGNADDFELAKFSKKLGRDIQLFSCKNKIELEKFNNLLIKNIASGDIIKGNLDFLEVKIHA